MKKWISTLLTGMLTASAVTCFAAASQKEIIQQVALLQSLALGQFEGSITAKELKTLGDTGIGTFDGLNGELILLNGTVYRGNADCSASIVPDDETIPFTNVTFFEPDITSGLSEVSDKPALDEALNQLVSENGKNSFYMVKLHGSFREILIRSESKAQKPYPSLVEHLKQTQQEKTLKDVKGTIVGLYCPDYMSSLNSTGWHYHFISDDRKYGGHVLNLNLKSGKAELDKTDRFALQIPDDRHFHSLDLGTDLREDIHKAENDTVPAAR